MDDDFYTEWVDRFIRKVDGQVRLKLREGFLAALGEPMDVETGPPEMPNNEVSWRRGWNACRGTLLEAVDRLLPPEEE